jgi:hypothetical protein
MLFRMLVLIAEPRVPPLRLAVAISQHRIERDDAKTRQPRNEMSQPQRDASECVVEAAANCLRGGAASRGLGRSSQRRLSFSFFLSWQ